MSKLMRLSLMIVLLFALAACGQPNLTQEVEHEEEAAAEVEEGEEAAAEGEAAIGEEEELDETGEEDEAAIEVDPDVGEEAAAETPEEEPTAEETGEEATEAPQEDEEDEGAPIEPGDPEAGEALFNQMMPEAGFACANCHLVDSEDRLVGPGLLGIPSRAAERVEGQSAVEYLYNSIVNSNAYVVGDYPENLMPQNYEELFTEEEISDLVGYLMTLEQ